MSDIRYTEDHVWVAIDDDGVATIGISDYAQEQLGDIVYVQLPDIGRDVEEGEEMVMIESVKTTGEIRCPVAGRIIEVNDLLTDTPERINESALDEGWLCRLEPTDEMQIEELMSADDYEDFLGTLS